MTAWRPSKCRLQTAQEVRLLNRLSPRLAGTLGNLRALFEAISSIVQPVDGRITVIGSGGDIVGVVVSGDLRREFLSASSELLLVALSLLLVQGCDGISIGIGWKLDRGSIHILLGSTPPLAALASLLESPSRSQSQSGYSWSSLATISGLFLK